MNTEVKSALTNLVTLIREHGNALINAQVAEWLKDAADKNERVAKLYAECGALNKQFSEEMKERQSVLEGEHYSSDALDQFSDWFTEQSLQIDKLKVDADGAATKCRDNEQQVFELLIGMAKTLANDDAEPPKKSKKKKSPSSSSSSNMDQSDDQKKKTRSGSRKRKAESQKDDVTPFTLDPSANYRICLTSDAAGYVILTPDFVHTHKNVSWFQTTLKDSEFTLGGLLDYMKDQPEDLMCALVPIDEIYETKEKAEAAKAAWEASHQCPAPKKGKKAASSSSSSSSSNVPPKKKQMNR